MIERNTRQKRAIRDAFMVEDRPLSTGEAFAAAQTEIQGLGIATVYRSIRSLLEDGWLTASDVPGKGTLYEPAEKEHHHHSSCTKCLRVFELDGCLIGLTFAEVERVPMPCSRLFPCVSEGD